MDKNFESKVAELVAVTQQLDVMRILAVRRMTMSDPQTLKWANPRQLELIFNVILAKGLTRTPIEQLAAASEQQFDPLLPPGPEDARDQERWLLFDLARPVLSGYKPATTETTEEAVLEELAAEEEEAPRAFGDFNTMFDEALVRHTRRVLAALAVKGSRPHIPAPFYAAPAFGAVYEQVLRQYVLGPIRKARSIKELADSRDWTVAGAEQRLVGMALADTPKNPVRHHWDARWGVFEPGRAGAKNATLKPEDDPWEVFKADAAKNDYACPTWADIPMLQRILRWDPEALAAQWEAVAQIYQQEFHPKDRSDQARAGAFRDKLIHCIEKMDNHGGDMMAVKAFFDCPKCDRQFLRELLRSLGRSEADRLRAAPLLIDFLNNLPK